MANPDKGEVVVEESKLTSFHKQAEELFLSQTSLSTSIAPSVAALQKIVKVVDGGANSELAIETIMHSSLLDPDSVAHPCGSCSNPTKCEKMLFPKKSLGSMVNVVDTPSLGILGVSASVDEIIERESLKFRLLGSKGDIGSWGHEYVRNLAGEIAQEYQKRQMEEAHVDDLMDLVQQIASFHVKHNAEREVVDLSMEVEELDMLIDHIDAKNYKRTCFYLTSFASYVPGPDDMYILDLAYSIYTKIGEYTNALRVALCMHRMQYVKAIFTACVDPLQKKKLCYILARQGVKYRHTRLIKMPTNIRKQKLSQI